MYDGSTPSESELIASNCDNSYPFIAKMNKSLPAGTYSIELTTNDPVIELDYILCTSLALTQNPTNTTTTIPNSTTTTTIETDCPLTVENSFLPLRAGLFARLRRIVIKAANAQWDGTSQVTIDDINTIIQRGKDQETIIAWIIIPGKLIANFEPGPKVVLVQTPGKDDCIGEIVIE
jgi:hypothetical protein